MGRGRGRGAHVHGEVDADVGVAGVGSGGCGLGWVGLMRRVVGRVGPVIRIFWIFVCLVLIFLFCFEVVLFVWRIWIGWTIRMLMLICFYIACLKPSI